MKAFIQYKADINAKKAGFEDISTFFEGGVSKTKVSTLAIAKRNGNQEIIDLLVRAGTSE